MITRIPTPHTTGFIASILAFLIAATGCAVAPPVQEMSDARQAIRAAIEAEAEEYAPETLQEAESLLDTATRDLESGDYQQAKQAATEAREKAIKARDEALMAGERD
jgi:hypothetical protein